MADHSCSGCCGCNKGGGDDIKAKIAEVIDTVRTMLQADGGDIEIVEINEE